MTARLLAIITSLAALTAACSADQPVQPEEQLEAPNDIAWEELGDGSFLSRAEAFGNVSLRRCWETERDFDCILLESFSTVPDGEVAPIGGRSLFLASRYQEGSLEYGHEREARDGYACEFFTYGGMEEHLSNGHDYIASQQVQLRSGLVGGIRVQSSGQPWSSDYKDTLMRDNAIQHISSSFDCAHLARAVMDASVEVFASSVVGYADLID